MLRFYLSTSFENAYMGPWEFVANSDPITLEKIPISPIACIGIPGDSAINETDIEPLVDLMIANLNADTVFATQGAYYYAA